MMKLRSLSILSAFAIVALGSAQIRITEWMYNGTGTTNTTTSEYVEVTNLGSTSVSLTGWLFDDDSRNADPSASTSLSGLGLLAPGQSGLIIEASAADFRTLWGLSPTVPIVGNNTNNLSRGDEINIYDASGTLVDRLTYNDQATSGPTMGPRTNNVSGNILSAYLGANNASAAKLSTNGDAFGSRTVSGVLIGNPGVYPVQATPEPTSLAAFGVGALALLRRRRKA